MSSVYHILDKLPAIYEYELQIEYEQLAQSLVKSGRLRIDTYMYCNFARFTDPRINASLMVSREELTDPKLIPHTRKIFKNIYQNKIPAQELEHKIAKIFKDLMSQINKLLPVSIDLMTKLARIFVQSAHPIVIKWLLYDRVEVFITYSHNIGDMMDMVSWRHSGSNSGMQSTDGQNVAIFVSCGGDPLAKNNPNNKTFGDGWPALARMQIIAAQELGHFADIMRNSKGQQIGRHSANFNGTRANEAVKIARLEDIKNCNELLKILLPVGLAKMIGHEERLKFYEKNKVKGIKIIFLMLIKFIYKQRILIYAHNHHLSFIKRFKDDKYMGLMIQKMIQDMKSNLSPNADVYKSSDKDAEEAIACIEALARVPQQVMKWGYLTTAGTMSELYKIYYGQVIPSLINNYQALTERPYRRNYDYQSKNLIQYIKRIFKKPEFKPVPIRDI